MKDIRSLYSLLKSFHEHTYGVSSALPTLSESLSSLTKWGARRRRRNNEFPNVRELLSTSSPLFARSRGCTRSLGGGKPESATWQVIVVLRSGTVITAFTLSCGDGQESMSIWARGKTSSPCLKYDRPTIDAILRRSKRRVAKSLKASVPGNKSWKLDHQFSQGGSILSLQLWKIK